MGGQLTAHSEGLGKGATFTLELPLAGTAPLKGAGKNEASTVEAILPGIAAVPRARVPADTQMQVSGAVRQKSEFLPG